MTHLVNVNKRVWIKRELHTFTMCGLLKSQGEIFTERMVIIPDSADKSKYSDCEGCCGQG